MRCGRSLRTRSNGRSRAELGEALAFLAPRMQGLELDGEPGYDSVHGIYGLLELPVRWNPV